MQIFELSIGTTRRYIAAVDGDDAYKRGTDPEQQPDLYFLPFDIKQVTVPGYVIELTPETVELRDDLPNEREDMKAWLTERGVEFNPRLGDAKLQELVINFSEAE